MRNLLVTGGAGFVGSAFVRSVLGGTLPGLAGTRVTVLDKLTYAGQISSLGPVAEDENLDFVPGDICDEALVDTVLRGHDAIVHFAAETDAARSIEAAAGFAATNVVGTQILLDAARRHGTGRFLQVCTADGSPDSPYAATKAGAELMALAAYRTHGLPVVVTRSADNYGPYQHPEKLIPRYVTDLLRGRPVPPPADGARPRDWVHVDDHCRALARALLTAHPGEIRPVDATHTLTDQALTDLIRTRTTAHDAQGHSGAVELRGAGPATPTGPDRRRDPTIDPSDHRPGMTFDAGLAATIRWYRDNEEWWRPLVTD